MGTIIAIGLGGAIGALARYAVSSQITHVAGSAFPWGILIVNVAGCFLMGVIAELSALSWNLSPELRALLTTGILGGFTTFSAFALDSAVMIERGDWGATVLYVSASVLGSITALFLGLLAVRSFAA